MKIGITERGDASIDFSWVNKIKNVDGAIIISKGFNDKFKNELISNQDYLPCNNYWSWWDNFRTQRT